MKNIMTSQKRFQVCLGAVLFGLGVASGNVYSADADASKTVADVDVSKSADDVGDVKNWAGDGTDHNFHMGGYAAVWAGFNLNNVPIAYTPQQNNRYDLNMLRASLSLNTDFTTGPLQWKAIFRADKEYETSYLSSLEKANQTNSPGGPGSNIMNSYDNVTMRELYADYDLSDRIHLRLGKQQVAWGESDFFHPMDLIDGTDYRWHFFLEREGDEIRKAQIMANAKFDFPEANGTLQVLLRPGWDEHGALGDTYEMSGGRWAQNGSRGYDYLAGVPYDYHHSGADISTPTGGVRWTGMAGPVNYSLSYLKTANPAPIVNSAFNPWNGAGPANGFAEFIHPIVDLFGASVSGTVPAIDTVVGAEVAYQRDMPYNVGTTFFIPGFNGITTKNVVVSSLRLDKQFKLMDILGTSQASFASIQIFDTWIRDFKHSDDLVWEAGFAPAREHTTMLTGFATLNYMSSRLNPGLSFAYDLNSGDGLLSPIVDFNYGTHWRFRAEADLFYANNSALPSNKQYLLGSFAHSDQLIFRTMYQF